MQPPETDLEKFERHLQRLLKRKIIAESLHKSPSYRLAIKATQQESKQTKVSSFVGEIMRTEFNVHPQARVILDELDSFLEEALNGEIIGLTIVLLGSNAHGGAVWKSALSGSSDISHDLDIAILYDKSWEPSAETLWYLDSLIRYYLDLRFEKRMCDFFRPGKFFFSHLESASEAELLIHTFVRDEHAIGWNNPLLFYFNPGTNMKRIEQNRKYIADALQNLYQENNKLYHDFANVFAKHWKSVHCLSFSHLTNGDFFKLPNRDRQIALSASELSGSIMSRPFLEWLHNVALPDQEI
jgi:hypothetical protein